MLLRWDKRHKKAVKPYIFTLKFTTSPDKLAPPCFCLRRKAQVYYLGKKTQDPKKAKKTQIEQEKTEKSFFFPCLSKFKIT